MTYAAGAADAASVVSELESPLPAALPAGAEFVSALTTNAFIGAVPATILNPGGFVTISFAIPPAFVGRTLSVLYWDLNLNFGLGGWVELRFPMAILPDGTAEDATDGWLPASLDHRLLAVPTFTAEGRIEIAVNFTGTFVLVAR